MEHPYQFNQALSADRVRQIRRHGQSTTRTCSQNQQLTSTDSVFGRLRSTALSMKQKLSRAKQDISVKIADLDKQKVSNEMMRNRINEINTSLATLRAEISQKDQSLAELKNNADAFQELNISAGMTFQNNDFRFEAVELCVKDSVSDSKEITDKLNAINMEINDVRSNLSAAFSLLELCKESIPELDAMTLDTKQWNTTINCNIQELSAALESLEKESIVVRQTCASPESSNLESVYITKEGFLVLSISTQRLSIMMDAIATLNKRLSSVQNYHNQLMSTYGNALDFEHYCVSKCNFLEEVQARLTCAARSREETESDFEEIQKLNESIRNHIETVENCIASLSSCIDKGMTSTLLSEHKAPDGLKLSQRLSKLECFKEKKCMNVTNTCKKLESDISHTLDSIQNVSIELQEFHDKRVLLNHRISSIRELQFQFLNDILETVDMIEQYSLSQKLGFEESISHLNRLTSKLHSYTLKKEMACDVDHYAMIADIKQSKMKIFHANLASLQLKKEQISKLCQNLIEQNRNIRSQILDCQRKSSTLSEEIKKADAAARRESVHYESQIGELQKEFEMKLRCLQTKKIKEQFENEFNRTQQFQERELNNKLKQLRSIIIEKELEEKGSTCQDSVQLSQKPVKGDFAESEANGGQECPRVTPERNVEKVKNLPNSRGPARIKAIRSASLKKKKVIELSDPESELETPILFSQRSSPNISKGNRQSEIGSNKRLTRTAPPLSSQSGTRHRRHSTDVKDKRRSTTESDLPSIDPFAFT